MKDSGAAIQIAFWTLVVATIMIPVSILIPEIRRTFGLDQVSAGPVVHVQPVPVTPTLARVEAPTTVPGGGGQPIAAIPTLESPTAIVLSPEPTRTPTAIPSTPIPSVEFFPSATVTADIGGGGFIDAARARTFFIIQPDVRVRKGPSTQTEVIGDTYTGQKVAVVEGSEPYLDGQGTTWWHLVITASPLVVGWVAEVAGEERLLKPSISIQETMYVVNPLCAADSVGRGQVSLFLTPSEHDTIALPWGTELEVLEGPLPTYRGDPSDEDAATQGREWWRVRVINAPNQLPVTEGWIADFYLYYRQMLIAPSWYRDSSPQIQLAASSAACP